MLRSAFRDRWDFSLAIFLLLPQKPGMEFGRSSTAQDQVQVPSRGTRGLAWATGAAVNVQS